jgi:glycosyltransferase involved in cell wall biosynthesis
MFKIALLASHPPSKDPRCEWFASAAPDNVRIELFGVTRMDTECQACGAEDTIHIIPRKTLDPEKFLYPHLFLNRNPLPATNELNNCYVLSRETNDALARTFHISPNEPRLQNFKCYMKHFADTAASLVEHIAGKDLFDAVIACDLDTLIPGIILKNAFGCPLIYDAHEYWAHADVQQAEFEKRFWTALEARLLAHVDLAATVSTPLSQVMSDDYGTIFETLPNAEPIQSASIAKASRSSDATCTFLFQGGFAQGRGIDLLINAWPSRGNTNARLLLRGPHSAERSNMIALARKRGLLNRSIFFPEPVSEAQLVETASLADVGIIPYTAAGLNYKYCCPNKMSQYMAAGIALLANKTDYVSSIVQDSDAGILVDFSDKSQLEKTIRDLANNSTQRRRYASNAKQYFTHTFNWNKLSKPFYRQMTDLINISLQQPRQVRKTELSMLSNADEVSEVQHAARPTPLVAKAIAKCAVSMWSRFPEAAKRDIRRFLSDAKRHARSLQG